jgi:large subunit ribosomal protein L24
MSKIRKQDTVKVLLGKDRGKTGRVIVVDGKTGKATVEGLNIYFRHERSRKAGQKGQKIQFPRPMAISNLMLVCPHCRKAARIGYLVDEQGTKTRMCKNCKKRI